MSQRSLRTAGLLAALLTTATTCGCSENSGRKAESAAPGAIPAVLISTATGAGAVDVGRSRVYVFVDKKGAGHRHGVEGRLASGSVYLGRTAQAGKLTFDMRSFAADTGPARRHYEMEDDIDADEQAEITTTMRGTSILDAANHPTAEFAIRSTQPAPPQPDQPGTHYQIEGDLTLHGVGRPVGFTARAETIDGLVRLHGTFTLKQTDYGIRPFKKLFGAIGVADELKIYGELWLTP
jgi:polyisoprenoid-binding protein YceI